MAVPGDINITMARPQPTAYLEHSLSKSNKEQILYSAGIWAVLHDNHAINIKSVSKSYGKLTSKYKKSSFSNKGHAINLCRKLNTRYKTDKFTVMYFEHGLNVYP